MPKLQRTWEDALLHKRRRWRGSPYPSEKSPSWLVELTPIRHPELSVVEIVDHARDEWEATYLALSTRNMANNWHVTEVEKAA